MTRSPERLLLRAMRVLVGRERRVKVTADTTRLYDVQWRRPNDPEVLECRNLTAELLAFRIRGVIRMCGSVELLSLTPVRKIDDESTFPQPFNR